MEIREFDGFVRQLLGELDGLPPDSPGRAALLDAIDTALLAYEPQEWADYWAGQQAIAADGQWPDAQLEWMGCRLLVVWAGPPAHRMPEDEVICLLEALSICRLAS